MADAWACEKLQRRIELLRKRRESDEAAH